MRILLINHYAGSKRHGMEYRPYYLARQWIAQGHQVRIVAASESHVRDLAVDIHTPWKAENIDGIQYLWMKTPSYQGNGIARAVNMFSFVSKLFRFGSSVILRDFKADAVIASSTYPLDIYPAHRLARLADARLIFEVHDLWPLSPIELSGMSRRHPFIVLLQHAEDYACRHADRIVSLLPKAEQHLRQRGMAADKFVYIPNGVNIQQWRQETAPAPTQITDTIDQLRSQNCFIVGYAGAHGLANALGALIAAAELLKQQPVAFLLIGQGPEKAHLRARARKLGLGNVHFFEPVAKSTIPAVLSLCDALYIGLQKQSLFRFGVSPNKLMDYMMAERPVIQAIEAGNDMVGESGCGLTIEPENAGAIADAVLSLRNLSPGRRQEMGKRGGSYVRRHHDYETLSRRFADVMTA